jgi:hypothetical protein
MVWSVLLFTNYLSVMWLAQYTQDVTEWLLQTFGSWRGWGGGGIFAIGNIPFVEKSASIERVAFYYRFSVSCFFLPSTRLIETEMWKSFYSVFFWHILCAEGRDCVLIWGTLILSARRGWIKIWKPSVTCIVGLNYLHVIYSGCGVKMSLLVASFGLIIHYLDDRRMNY